jgi:hypothetical protein
MRRKFKYIVSSFLVITALMLTIALVHTFAQVETDKYSLGCLMETPEMLESIPKAKSLKNRAALPSVVDLSGKMPAPGNQGSQNSCAAWAVAYAYKSFQEKLEHNWDLNNSNHIFSPAYVYNQINGGVDRGSYISKAMELIVKQGVCPWKDMPYTAGNYWSQPTDYQKQRAAKYKALNYMYIEAGNVATMKAHLAAGDVLIAGVPVYPDFNNLSASNPIYDNASGTKEGNHAICFVGYDDSKRAFKFINSWGTGYGLGGYGYMAYDLVTWFQINSFFMTDIIDSTTVITIKVWANGKYVCADYNINNTMIGDRSVADTWEKYAKINNNDGTISLRSLTNNKYVCADLNQDGKLIARSDSIDTWEKFKVIDMGNGNIALQSLANHKYVSCDLNRDAVLYVNIDNPSTWETFTLSNNLLNGLYMITNKCSDKVLDIKAASTEDSAQLQQWAGVDVANQKFKVEIQEDGYYKITAQHSGKVLDVPYSTKSAGAQLQQWEDNGTDAQRWQIIDDGNGYYKIISKTSGLLIDVLNASTADGAVVQQFTDNGNDAQRWSFTLDSN